MSDIDFRQNGKRISGSNGSSGYDEGNRLTIDGKTFYKEGNNRYYCPDDGKIYNTDNGHISTLEDGIIGIFMEINQTQILTTFTVIIATHLKK